MGDLLLLTSNGHSPPWVPSASSSAFSVMTKSLAPMTSLVGGLLRKVALPIILLPLATSLSVLWGVWVAIHTELAYLERILPQLMPLLILYLEFLLLICRRGGSICGRTTVMGSCSSYTLTCCESVDSSSMYCSPFRTDLDLSLPSSSSLPLVPLSKSAEQTSLLIASVRVSEKSDSSLSITGAKLKLRFAKIPCSSKRLCFKLASLSTDLRRCYTFSASSTSSFSAYHFWSWIFRASCSFWRFYRNSGRAKLLSRLY